MKELKLRRFRDEGALLFEKWLYMPHVVKWYHDPSDWIDEVKKRNDGFSFINHYFAESDGNPIGFCQYYEYRHGFAVPTSLYTREALSCGAATL
ncbi:MAG: hypothetical protein PHI27_02670 [Eubacteriales bacterium]|nr:hypothetical protein [Eubacteriales bacterium]MDD3881137.1 hypothetical protein [Eubacteriales bacterium]MDD4511519.1 hypothetical protein [Eubacteriales bacterium]